MSFHAAYPLTTGLTFVDKNILLQARLHESWADTINVGITLSPIGLPWPITIVECRVEFDDFAKTVIRAPGSGQPGDCDAWTEGSVSILSKPMKILDPDNDTTKVIPGVTYPVTVGAGPGLGTTMPFSGTYTKILFPCDRVEWLDGNTTSENIVESHPYADEKGLELIYDNVPKSYDHLTEFRPDPTHDVTLTYHIHVVYQGGTYGVPPVVVPNGYEIHTITQKVLNNPDDNVKIIKYLLNREIGLEEQQAKYGFGDGDPKYEQYKII